VKEIHFLRQKLAYSEKLAQEFITNPKVEMGMLGDDFATNTVTSLFSALIWDRLNESKTITIDFQPPTFWDWLKRLRKTYTVTFEARECLLKPKEMPEGQSVMMYVIKEDND
jgi:hypothetical protein